MTNTNFITEWFGDDFKGNFLSPQGIVEDVSWKERLRKPANYISYWTGSSPGIPENCESKEATESTRIPERPGYKESGPTTSELRNMSKESIFSAGDFARRKTPSQTVRTVERMTQNINQLSPLEGHYESDSELSDLSSEPIFPPDNFAKRKSPPQIYQIDQTVDRMSQDINQWSSSEYHKEVDSFIVQDARQTHLRNPLCGKERVDLELDHWELEVISSILARWVRIQANDQSQIAIMRNITDNVYQKCTDVVSNFLMLPANESALLYSDEKLPIGLLQSEDASNLLHEDFSLKSREEPMSGVYAILDAVEELRKLDKGIQRDPEANVSIPSTEKLQDSKDTFLKLSQMQVEGPPRQKQLKETISAIMKLLNAIKQKISHLENQHNLSGEQQNVSIVESVKLAIIESKELLQEEEALREKLKLAIHVKKAHLSWKLKDMEKKNKILMTTAFSVAQDLIFSLESTPIRDFLKSMETDVRFAIVEFSLAEKISERSG
ncbi:MAG: hypothetical protein M1829_006410 [Trizodia sp. TS-e1964]|nr:MAG: hypothetical protein M1829_006410 [Trizodia sp. TS-e1964]